MLVKHAARLEKSTDHDSLWAGTVETLRSAGFDHAIYLTVDAEGENPFLRCTLDGLYDPLDPRRDPFLRYTCDSYDILPIGLAFADRHPYLEPEERRLLESGAARGMTAALGIPMRLRGSDRFGGFIIGNGMGRIDFANRILPRSEEFRLFCLIVHRRFEELSSCDPAKAPPEDSFRDRMLAPDLPEPFDALTLREREVIYLLAHGHTRQQAAAACDISVHTVSDYAKAAYRKLGVNNRGQVAALIRG